nr:diguanylate cyclase [Desulfobacula sp.]
MKYRVKTIKSSAKAGAAWDTAPWDAVPFLALDHHMGPRPDHFPRTEAKLFFDGEAVCVMFRVEDRYVRALATHDQDKVFEDSCVEFFFTPGPDASKGYFNLEMNCGGVLLFHFQTARGKNRVVVPEKECEMISRGASLPRRVDPEIREPVTWTVSYRLPLGLMEKYAEVAPPAPGVQWRANFYKCGDRTSHSHWLTWSRVNVPRPDFHRPECFGTLEFE